MDFQLDLLFYHLKLRRFVVVELNGSSRSRSASRDRSALRLRDLHDGHAVERRAHVEPHTIGVLVAMIDAGRRAAVRASNAIMTATYWGVGRRIVEEEQHGAARAEYGEGLNARLSQDLQTRFGRGFSYVNLTQMRSFYLGYREILQTASGESGPALAIRKLQTASEEFLGLDELARVAGRFPLPWSCYVRLQSVRNPEARTFYEGEALRGGWTVRQLDRQIGSQFYERTALSKNKAAMLRKGQQQTHGDVMTPEEEIKDPFFFEFLNLSGPASTGFIDRLPNTGAPATHVRATPLANFTLATASPRAVARAAGDSSR